MSACTTLTALSEVAVNFLLQTLMSEINQAQHVTFAGMLSGK